MEPLGTLEFPNDSEIPRTVVLESPLARNVGSHLTDCFCLAYKALDLDPQGPSARHLRFGSTSHTLNCFSLGVQIAQSRSKLHTYFRAHTRCCLEPWALGAESCNVGCLDPLDEACVGPYFCRDLAGALYPLSRV